MYKKKQVSTFCTRLCVSNSGNYNNVGNSCGWRNYAFCVVHMSICPSQSVSIVGKTFNTFHYVPSVFTTH